MPTQTTTIVRTCPRCTLQNAPQARFCRQCGSPLSDVLAQATTIMMGAPAGQAASRPSFATIPPDLNAHIAAGTGTQQRECTCVVQDVSGSMGERYDDLYTKLVASQRAACAMVIHKTKLDPLDEMAVVSFTDSAQIVCPMISLDTGKPRLIQTIQSLTAGGGTDTNAALKAARDAFDRSRNDAVKRIVFQTDGQGGDPLSTANELKARGVIIDVVGVGESPSAVNEKLLKQVASVIAGETRYRFIKNDSATLIKHYTTLALKTKVG
ncbi:MAG: VWA domain-containing protein [Phycisphaerae bacterium]|nr:VWA domain-containing protein [Phycisphaerae bacterium]